MLWDLAPGSLSPRWGWLLAGERKAEVSSGARGFPRGKATGDVRRSRKGIGKLTEPCSQRCRDVTRLQPGIAPTARQRRGGRGGARLESHPGVCTIT